MEKSFDQNYLLKTMQKLIETPSPVGYYSEVNPLMEQLARELGYSLEYDNRKTAYLALPGRDLCRTVCICAHLDTLGLMIRKIDADGMIRVRNLGGINYHNIDGESVTVITKDGRKYTGLCVCQSHSTHVFDDARTLQRDEDTMIISLDAPIHSAEDVRKLGIRNGDYIYLEPHFQLTRNGYLKSRFLDDKAAVAIILSVVKYMRENHLKPSCNILFSFPHYEEIGTGGTFVPQGVEKYIAMDMAVIGPGYESSEEKVTICAKDVVTPYDRDLTNHLIAIAEKLELNYAVDVFHHYSTDAGAAIRGGNNIAAAAFGFGTFSSHGMERTHISAIQNTAGLLFGYLMEA